MAEIKWYKRDPDAALSGMMQLSLEERGAYNTVLDLIYSRADKLLDDDRMIAGFLSCDLRVWKRIKTKLIELGKLHVEDGLLRNLRATSEILKALSRVASAAEAGRASALARAAKLETINRENNGIAPTPVPTPVERPLQLSTATATAISRAKLSWDELETKLRQAAGWQSEPHPNLSVVGQIAALIDSGADLERDVLPIVKAKAPLVRKRTSWNFFVDPIREARDKRLAIQAPQPQSATAPIWENWTDRQYEAAIIAAKRGGRWPETFGPIERIPEHLVDDELKRILRRAA